MTITHPFDRIPPGRVRVGLLPVLVLTLVVLAVLGALDPPGGIIGLELAGSVAAANELMAGWSSADITNAAFGTGLDYVFLLAYGNAIALSCIWGRRAFRASWLVAVGGLLAWGAWLAAALDSVENIAMFHMIRGPVSSPAPQIATACATPKFVLVYSGVAYALAAAFTRLWRRSPT